MKGSEYSKDRITAYLMRAIALMIALIFLFAFRVQVQAIIVVAVIFLMTSVSLELWDYWRKREFYQRLATALAELDQKYLLPELVEQPGFYEGRLFADVLRECDKSMAEHVADYRRQNREFREYIELWVHEAKIPVASLRLMCHNNGSTPKKMIGQIGRIDDYIENVLYYARSENAEKDYVIKEVSLQKCFGSVAVKNREALQILGAEIETSGLNRSVMTDGKWLEYIIGQLMANSMKYSSPEHKLVIRVHAEQMDDRVLFHFKDNGKGIDASDLPYVFEKSFTGKNGRENQGSTGMGLYIVRNLCERLGHQIEVFSEYGEYTEVLIHFMKHDFYKMDEIDRRK